MNQYEWKQQARRLMASQEKFVQMMYLQHEHTQAMINYMSGFKDYMGGFREAFGSWSEVFKTVHHGMQKN